MDKITQITVDGKTYDINDSRVDDIDEVVVVDPSTLTVEEFCTLSDKFLNGNVTILLKVDSTTRVMVHTVGYNGTEDYGRWEASALTTSADDDVDFTYAEFDLYKVYYNPNSNTVSLEKETRSYPNGKLYIHRLIFSIDPEEIGDYSNYFWIGLIAISTDSTPLTNLIDQSDLYKKLTAETIDGVTKFYGARRRGANLYVDTSDLYIDGSEDVELVSFSRYNSTTTHVRYKKSDGTEANQSFSTEFITVGDTVTEV